MYTNRNAIDLCQSRSICLHPQWFREHSIESLIWCKYDFLNGFFLYWFAFFLFAKLLNVWKSFSTKISQLGQTYINKSSIQRANTIGLKNAWMLIILFYLLFFFFFFVISKIHNKYIYISMKMIEVSCCCKWI